MNKFSSTFRPGLIGGSYLGIVANGDKPLEYPAIPALPARREAQRNRYGVLSWAIPRDRLPNVITWLASYPRSGNTLLRTVLKCCFGQVSQSIYSDEEFEHPTLKEIVGKEVVGANPYEFVNVAKRQNRRLYVKTHELPHDNAQPTIYVVRDGRSCVVSHYHYIRDILGRDVTLENVIRGALGSSWSQHVNAWALSGRHNTLVVRYEELATGCLRTLRAISAFIGQPLLREFDISFDQLHALYPSFFRRGSDSANLGDLDADSTLLFGRLHGDTLRKIGYGSHIYVNPRVPISPTHAPR